MRKDAPWRIDKESVLTALVGKQRCGERQRLGFVRCFVARCPERTSRVHRVEDHIATGGRIKLRQEFHGGVVDDGRLPPLLDLQEDLPNGRAFAHPGIAHDEKVHRLPLARHTHPAVGVFSPKLVQNAAFLIYKRHAVSRVTRVELRRRYQLWPAQPVVFEPA